MVQGKNAEATEVLPEEIEADVAQAKGEPQGEPVDLAAKVSQLEKDLEAARAEAKSHQKFGQQTKAELDRKRGLETTVKGLENRIQVVTDMLADIVDRGDSDFETEPPAPKERRSQRYLSRIQEATVSSQEQERQAREAEFLRVAREADELAKSAGYEMATSPEMEKAYLYFRAGDENKGLAEVRKVVGEAKKTEAPNDEKYQQDVEEAARKLVAGKGWLRSDASEPSGAVASEAKIRADYREDPDNPAKRARYLELRREKGW